MIPRVRKMCDGEELVLVEGQGAGVAVEADPREALYDRRSRAAGERRRTTRSLPFRKTAEPPRGR